MLKKKHFWFQMHSKRVI